jgi:hypothetical protein
MKCATSTFELSEPDNQVKLNRMDTMPFDSFYLITNYLDFISIESLGSTCTSLRAHKEKSKFNFSAYKDIFTKKLWNEKLKLAAFNGDSINAFLFIDLGANNYKDASIAAIRGGNTLLFTTLHRMFKENGSCYQYDFFLSLALNACARVGNIITMSFVMNECCKMKERGIVAQYMLDEALDCCAEAGHLEASLFLIANGASSIKSAASYANFNKHDSLYKVLKRGHEFCFNESLEQEKKRQKK